MVVCDTHVLIFDALSPNRLSTAARQAIEAGAQQRELACSDITLWEIAMLIAKGCIDPGIVPTQFINDLVLSRYMKVLPITPEIAVLSQTHSALNHGDPADRLIAATALHHRATLITGDSRLREVSVLDTLW